MILEWTLGNFKSVKQTPKLKFAPLTIICGANSSGKSTIIQSVLMISQTLGWLPILHIGSRQLISK